MAPKTKRVFISYAWESDEYKSWVKRFATRLRKDGIRARLDAWHLGEGENITEFMNREVRHADNVLILCSPQFKQKVHDTEDRKSVAGVGWEARLLGQAMLQGRTPIPVLARGEWSEAAPDYLAGQVYIDLSDDKNFEKQYEKLVRRIIGTAERAPPIEAPRERFDPIEPQALSVGDLAVEFRLVKDSNGRYTAEMRADGGPPVTTQFDLNLQSDETQAKRDLDAIDKNQCEMADIENLGNELMLKLLSGEVQRTFSDARKANADGIIKLRLTVPGELEFLPWEALHGLGVPQMPHSLATSPLSSVVRATEHTVAKPTQAQKPLKMMVVIPSGSELRSSSELEKIRQVIGTVKDAIELECLDGRVTADKLNEKLRQGWDIVHFIGHGRVNDRGNFEIRLNDRAGGDGDNEHWMEANLFASQFEYYPPRLIILNCCHGAAADPTGSSGLGGALMRANVPAIVMMRYEVDDSVAADFARNFYRELIGGKHAGRVDVAVQEGRAALARTYSSGDRVRSFITPVLYLAKDQEQLFDLEPVRVEAGTRAGEIDVRIDKRLVMAVQRGAFLPILGPDILAAGAVRSEEIPPGPGTLASTLAEKFHFPGLEHVNKLNESAAPWLTSVLFERVCQHAESQPGERYELDQSIREVYRDIEPPGILKQIASWNVPGMVYSYIDGLLESILEQHQGNELRPTPARDVTESTMLGQERLLLNLRGTYTHGESMVLTEEDSEKLLDQMGIVARLVEDMMNQVGSCMLLFLGVSSRDELVRALARRLLRSEARRGATAFFICDHMTDADRSYWRQFEKLECAELDAKTVIEGLTIATGMASEGEH